MFPNDKFNTLFEALRYRAETPVWMLWAFVAFLVLLGCLIYVGWRIQQKRELAHLLRSFNHLAREKRLTDTEIQWVWCMANATPYPLLVLTSATTFNQSLDKTDPLSENQLAIIRHKLGFDTHPLGRPLTDTQDIPIGQRLWVGIKRDGKAQFYRCVLVENTPTGLQIAPITKTDENAFRDPRPNETIYIRFWRRGDSEYQFKSQWLNLPDANTLCLIHSAQIKRLQHRDFFRLPVHIPVVIHAISSTEEAHIPPETLGNHKSQTLGLGRLTDLSAGGAALLTSIPITYGSHIWLAPIGESHFALLGVAGYVRDVAPEGKNSYRHRLEFVNLTDAHQDILARQIHQTQLSPSLLYPKPSALSH